MNKLLEMIQKVNNRTGDKLTKFCAPLVDHFGINHFYHYQLTNSGHYAAAGLNQGWHECFYSRPYPIATPYLRNSKKVNSGMVFSQTIEDENWKKVMHAASDEFDVNLSLHITTHTNEGVEAFGFGLKTNDALHHMALINELPYLQLFIQEYRNKFQTTLLKDNLVDIASLIGHKFNETPQFSSSASLALLKDKMQIESPSPFTRRESDVIKQLLNGYSASEIGGILYLSKRTIEHHLERLKDKLDCCSKAELIQKARNLESAGYFIGEHL